MKKKDFRVSRSCLVCPYREQARDREQLADERAVIYRWRCIVWGGAIDCLTRADALAELRRQCTIAVAFARHARSLSLREHLILDLKYRFDIDDADGVAYVNGVLYGKIVEL
jgi:hypothetical protein